MQTNSTMRGVTRVARPRRTIAGATHASFLLAASMALVACSDETLTQPKASMPAGGPDKPSAVIHIIPEGTTFPAKIAFATGSPVGKDAMVQIYDQAGKQMAAFYAFSAADDFTAGVDVTLGDVTGDGFPDIIAGEGPIPSSPWGVSQINVWDGKTGTLIQTATPFPNFKNGVRVGAADLDGDGKAEILACTGPGAGGNRALALKFGSNTPVYGSGANLFTNNVARTGGCHIAGGDINGDGHPEIVAQFDGANNVLLVEDLQSYSSMLVPDPLGWQYSGAADVALGDVNGDKVDDLIMSFLQDSAVVRVFDGSKIKLHTPLVTLKSFKPLYYWQGTGVDIAARDINGDGVSDLLFKPMKSISFGFSSMVGAYPGPSLTGPFLLWFTELGNRTPGGPIG